ncbi:MAG UNVERIFIED_CONTAM: metalloregulator ArsR/SmtB family transcription factor [Anaerolineae bacterium]|jgi:ArsR family transcriptional regulator
MEEQIQATLSSTDEARLVQMCKALGNEKRMQIVRFLRQHPACITNDIVAHTPLAQATISQHLKVLREAGIISGTIQGPAMCYCINEEAIDWLKQQIERL